MKKLVVDHFSEHFHAYKVFESDEKYVIKAESLVIYKPFDHVLMVEMRANMSCLYF